MTGSAENKKNGPLWIVEDSLEQTELLKKKLEQLGWKFAVSSFASAEEIKLRLENCLADEEKKNELPKLMIVDLGLPGENGLSLLKTLRARPELAQIPVIILTGSENSADMLQSYKSGAAVFLKKPLVPEILQEVLNQLKITNRF